jgi:hypothetical protein
MNFFVDEQVDGQIAKDLKAAGHRIFSVADLLANTELIELPGADRDFFAVLAQRQCSFVTQNNNRIEPMYENNMPFEQCVVWIQAPESAGVVERLFARYKRLTPRRMYTVTGTRVKVRQLPGAGQV